MRDEASLRRLLEMGIDAYVPRNSSRHAASAPSYVEQAQVARARVVMLARGDGDARPLLAQIGRALRFARIDSAVETSARADRITGAAGLVVFGEALAREAGAALRANQKGKPPWVAAADPASIAASGAAKRALWSELRRLIRALRATAPTLAG